VDGFGDIAIGSMEMVSGVMLPGAVAASGGEGHFVEHRGGEELSARILKQHPHAAAQSARRRRRT
jgi:hypothetical protein